MIPVQVLTLFVLTLSTILVMVEALSSSET
jgi:hypothetical protein